MQQIVLDATGFQNFQTGVGRYAYNLMVNLVPMAPDLRWVILVSRTLTQHHPIVDFAQQRSDTQIVAIGSPVIGPKRDLRFLFPIPRYDLYHCLNSNLPLFLNRRVIVTLHDLIYIKHPYFLGNYATLKGLYIDLLMRHIARSASHIIAVSDATAKDFRERYQKRRGGTLPLTVVHEAATPAIRQQNGVVNHPLGATNQEDPYFFYCGELRPHKNIDRLIEAFSLLRSRLQNSNKVKLIIAGSTHTSYALPNPLPHNVYYLGPIDDATLHRLFDHAIAFCFVSLYEGFGLPILEAMQEGTAVITSNISSMPEIAGDAACLVDPYNAEHIADAMYRLYNDQDVREEYIRRGRERAAQFSWQETARQTLEIYRSLL